ncbi:hypothetical protein ABET36_11985 [Caldifermentibacillus hisashii]|uniref:hypothetical protein n=1 Tax=Caldifermentibacillus hisashii TaxID=996558 RepID=UPI00310121BB|nr:hypothetical protein [Caldibacillus thermoamylovorans]
MNKPKKLKINITLPLFLVVFLIITGCSNSDNRKTESEDKNINTLEAVLNNTFNGPDKKLVELLNDPENATKLGEGQKNPENPTDLDLYLEEKYKKYFTADMYDEYIDKYALNYQIKDNELLKLENTNIKQNETNSNIYNFSSVVQYRKESQKSESYEVEGEANFTDDGKITNLKIFTDNKLSEKIREEQ